MSKEDPYRDQAEKLRQRFEKVNENPVDDSNLPPRGEMHRNRKKKTKWKLKFPIIRLLVLFFFLLLITIFSVYTYIDGKKYHRVEKASVSNQEYEAINFENNKTKNSPSKDSQVNQSPSEEATTGNDKKGVNSNGQSNPVTNQKPSVLTPPAPSTTRTNGADLDKNGKNVALTAKKENSYNIIYHTVQPQETLYRISMKYFHSDAGIEIIKQANHIQDQNIETGQVLKIPIKK